MSATSSTQTASVGRRLVAYLIDGFVVSILLGVCYALQIAGFLWDSSVLFILGALLTIIVGIGYPVSYIVIQGRSGATPGKRAMGIRTVDVNTGAPIGFGRALIRQLVLGILGPVNIVQLFTIGRHPRNQGWHDSAAKSVVVPVASTASSSSTVAAAPKRDLPGPRPATPWPASSVPSLASAPPALPPTGGISATQMRSAAPSQVSAPPGAAGPPPPAGGVQPSGSHGIQVGLAPPSIAPPPSIGLPPSIAPPPAGPEASVAPPPSVSPLVGEVWILRSASQHRAVGGHLLAGRDPDPDLVADAHTWVVDDPQLSVSKTHALFGLESGRPWVEDWHSTNGTVLHRAGEAITLAPHSRTDLRDGDVVALGDIRLVVAKEGA